MPQQVIVDPNKKITLRTPPVQPVQKYPSVSDMALRGLRSLGLQLPERLPVEQRIPLPKGRSFKQINPWLDRANRFQYGFTGINLDNEPVTGGLMDTSGAPPDILQAPGELVSALPGPTDLAMGLKGLGSGVAAIGALGHVDISKLGALIHEAKGKLPENIRSLGKRWWSYDADQGARQDYISEMLARPELIQDVRDTIKPAFSDTEFPAMRGIGSYGTTVGGNLPKPEMPVAEAARGFSPDPGTVRGFFNGGLWTGEASLDDVIALGNSKETELLMDPRKLKSIKYTHGYPAANKKFNAVQEFYNKDFDKILREGQIPPKQLEDLFIEFEDDLNKPSLDNMGIYDPMTLGFTIENLGKKGITPSIAETNLLKEFNDFTKDVDYDKLTYSLMKSEGLNAEDAEMMVTNGLYKDFYDFKIKNEGLPKIKTKSISVGFDNEQGINTPTWTQFKGDELKEADSFLKQINTPDDFYDLIKKNKVYTNEPSVTPLAKLYDMYKDYKDESFDHHFLVDKLVEMYPNYPDSKIIALREKIDINSFKEYLKNPGGFDFYDSVKKLIGGAEVMKPTQGKIGKPIELDSITGAEILPSELESSSELDDLFANFTDDGDITKSIKEPLGNLPINEAYSKLIGQYPAEFKKHLYGGHDSYISKEKISDLISKDLDGIVLSEVDKELVDMYEEFAKKYEQSIMADFDGPNYYKLINKVDKDIMEAFNNYYYTTFLNKIK